jgi:SAM-dependent methyltransferase
MVAFARRLHLPARLLSSVAAVVLLICFPFVASQRGTQAEFMWLLVGVHILVLFVGALLCHTRLAARRPDTRHLTEFYFIVALGGALGAAFTAIVAPSVFRTVIEYPLLVATLAFFRETGEPNSSDFEFKGADLMLPAALGFLVIGASKAMEWASVDITSDWTSTISINAVIVLTAFLMRRRTVRFALAVAVLIVTYHTLLPQFYGSSQFIYTARNFFGVKGVKFDLSTNSRRLLHGDTLHGLESLDPDLAGRPLSYYHETGPVGDIMKLLGARGDHQIGVVGLGTGSMAAWTAPHRRIMFFDIDPQVVEISGRFFTFLAECAENCGVRIGDGRLLIEQSADHSFDLLMLDAFNSDSIPAHLVSREAIAMYMRKLKPEGLLMFHVSNRYMDVEGLISAVVTDAGLEARVRHDEELQAPLKARSHYIVAGRNPDALGWLKWDNNWLTVRRPEGIAPWTDDYSNMVEILRWR